MAGDFGVSTEVGTLGTSLLLFGFGMYDLTLRQWILRERERERVGLQYGIHKLTIYIQELAL